MFSESRTVSIITLYNPIKKNIHNVFSIAKQSDLTIVCDNSDYSNYDLFNEISSIDASIIYRPFYRNLGLSAAFNNVLQDQNLGWEDNDFVIFFDQDSEIEENYIKKLEEEFYVIEDKHKNIGCLGPTFYDTSTCSIFPKKLKDTNCEISNIMTSSMLCRYRILRLSSFWNEQIFLDMADWDFCWRIRSLGLHCFITNKVFLHHSIGERIKKIGILKLRVGKPFREYYQTRDCLHLLKNSYVPFVYRLRFILQVTLRPILHLIFLDDRKERIYYILLGFKHYFQGIKGALVC